MTAEFQTTEAGGPEAAPCDPRGQKIAPGRRAGRGAGNGHAVAVWMDVKICEG